MSIWSAAGPASENQLAVLTSKAPCTLPAAYVGYLSESNGGEGDLGVEPGWVSLWPAETVRERNDSYEIAANLPGFFGFGSSGGGELLAFDTRSAQPWPIVMVPFVPMKPSEAVRIADSFEELREVFGVPLDENCG